jgi:hypothetical protein
MKHFHVKQLLHPWYVAGFAEGCGSFTYSRSSGVVALYFGIKVGVKDLTILQAIQAFFGGIGRIYITKASSEPLVNRREFAYFRVNRARELAQVAAHFDRYPLSGAKAQQYGIWREMVDLKQKFRRPDIERLTALAARLSSSTRTTDASP